jgi:hypothetical protein
MLFIYVRLVFLVAIGFVFAAGLVLIYLSRKAEASNSLNSFSSAPHAQPEDHDNETNLLSVQHDSTMLN